MNVPSYLLETPSLRVEVSALGATIRSIQLKTETGWLEVTEGFDEADEWTPNLPYFGVTVGRVANRIARARFPLGDRVVELEANDGPNQLHGGPDGFSQRVWQARQLGPQAIEFRLTSADGDQGYPGNLVALCRMTLSAENALLTEYEATTDQPTPVNFTNHTYFNLGGPSQAQVLDHVVWSSASHVLETNSEHLPRGTVLPVSGTPFDFRNAKALGLDIAQVAGGYDHCLVVEPHNNPLPELREVAKVSLPGTTRALRFSTDQSGFQLYSGNYLAGIRGRLGRTLVKHAAFCLESQRFPDSPNHPEWASIALQPGQTYRHKFVYAFDL
ncbi:MAG: aldose epimerase family protein [Spirochaetales bacterium]